MDFHVLPLAITMMAGPQIVSAIIFVTSKQAVRVSVAFLTGVLAATVAGVAIARGLVALLGNAVSFDDSFANSTVGRVIQYILVGLLALLALKNYLRRETSEPPKWLSTLVTAEPRKALATGLLLILLMPSDIVVMFTVAVTLEKDHENLGAAVPFILATLLIAALPLLGYLLFRHPAERAMPRVRDWTNSHSWLINICVCAIFILLILS